MFKIVWLLISGFFIFLAQSQDMSSSSPKNPPVPLRVVNVLNSSSERGLIKMIVFRNVGNEDFTAKWNISRVNEKKESISFYAPEHKVRPETLDTLKVFFKGKTDSCSAPLIISGQRCSWRVDFTIDQYGFKGALVDFSRK
jgi:hypothetical protein